MATLLCNNKARKAARAMIWVMLFVFFKRAFPYILSNSLHLWILIKRRKFIYIIFNFIIISILISSSSFTPYFTNLFLKLHQKIKSSHKILLLHNDDGFYSFQKVDNPLDDDTWWFFTTCDQDFLTIQPSEEDKEGDCLNHVEEKETREKEEEEEIVVDEEDSLEATWKAIMESKGKENGPRMTKSDTWSYGDGGVDEKRRGKGGLSKYKVKDELKKWQSYREVVEGTEFIDDGSGGDGGERGWRSKDAILTFHDDLKERSDDFIARIIHDIQLQRLESDQRFLDMINR